MAVAKPKNTLKEQRIFYAAMFGECCPEENNCSVEEIDNAISECESMTPFGCPARDYAKTLMLQSIIEGSDIEMCKKICCKDCEESCGYRCGRCY